MRMFGKSLSEYIEFQKVILGLIIVVGVVRLALSLAGVSVGIAKWFSITGALLIGIVYYGIRVPTRGFGGYKHLLPLSVIQNLLAQVIVDRCHRAGYLHRDRQHLQHTGIQRWKRRQELDACWGASCHRWHRAVAVWVAHQRRHNVRHEAGGARDQGPRRRRRRVMLGSRRGPKKCGPLDVTLKGYRER